MIRKLLVRVTRYHQVDKSKLESISEKPFFKHYKEAINLCLQNRLSEANEQFDKCLNQIKRSKEGELQHFAYVNRRIADNFRRLGQMKNAEQKLYEVIKYKRQMNINAVMIFDDYDKLFRHMIQYDIEKAIKLCKALLLKQKQQLSIYHTKLFNFNLANAYLLSGNYSEAIDKYSKCLQHEPQSKIKAYIYNNMGLAFWWLKNPLEINRNVLQKQDIQNIQKYFKQSKQFFAKSIEIAEGQGSEVDELHKVAVRQTLDFKHGTLNQNLQFKSVDSLFGVKNIAQFYLANDPLQKLQIMFWLKKAINLSKQFKKEKDFDRLYSSFSILSNNIDQLKQKLPGLIEKYRSTQNFVEQRYYNQLLGKIIAKQNKQKAAQYLDRAQLIRQVLPSWSQKLRYVAMQELDLTK